MKTCSKCKLEKPLTDFYPASWCSAGVRPDCKTCNKSITSKRASVRNKANPGPRRSTILKNKYGIDLAQYEDMLLNQNSLCKICGSSNPGPKGVFAVDHCHNTGKVRGLLCYLCNIGLGSFRDSVESLDKAIRYLKENGH